MQDAVFDKSQVVFAPSIAKAYNNENNCKHRADILARRRFVLYECKFQRYPICVRLYPAVKCIYPYLRCLYARTKLAAHCSYFVCSRNTLFEYKYAKNLNNWHTSFQNYWKLMIYEKDRTNISWINSNNGQAWKIFLCVVLHSKRVRALMFTVTKAHVWSKTVWFCKLYNNVCASQ